MKKVLFGVGILFITAYLFTNGLTQTFFQQDEWNGFGYVIFLRQSPWWAWFNLLGPSHFIPLSQFYWFVMYRLFGYEAQYYALNALTLHAIASFLVFMLAKKISQNAWIGALTAFLFVTNSRSAQAFTHLAVFPATITSFIVIMSFFLYLTGLKNKVILEKKDLGFLLGIFFVSVFLREDGLILPVLLPVYFWLFSPKVFQRKNLWFFAVFYAVIAAFFGFRVYIQTHAVQAIAVTGSSFKKIYLYNAISLPFKLIVQNIFEGINLFNAFWENKRLAYTEYHHQITVGLMYTVVYDFVILGVFNGLAAFFLFVSRKISNRHFWRSVLFCIAWILVAAFLLAAVGRPHNVVESRYLYLSSFAVLFIVSSTLIGLWSMPYRRPLLRMIVQAFIGLGIIVLTVTSYKEMQVTIKRYVFQSSARKNILVDLMKIHPTIPKKAIFYVACKTTCYRNIEGFGVPNDLVLPYTSGPGWIILLYYAQKDEKAYAQFFTPYNGKEFLWDYGAEGYRTVGEYGFGFFRTKELLLETLERESLPPETVIGVTYDETDFSLHDMSPQFVEELRHDLATRSAGLR